MPAPHVDRLTTPLLRVDHLAKTFHQDGHDIKALAGVSAVLWPGETLGLVGESGSGKTTFARTLLGIVEPSAGTVEIDGRTMPAKLGERTAADVAASADRLPEPRLGAQPPPHRAPDAQAHAREARRNVGGGAADRRAEELVDAVRLPERACRPVRPGLSGGQKQRVAIARAFAGEPRLVVCDEPTSALDVSVQAAILKLLVDLQATNRTSYVFISHDLGVVRYLSDRIAVLYLGREMELGPAERSSPRRTTPTPRRSSPPSPRSKGSNERGSSSRARSRRPRTALGLRLPPSARFPLGSICETEEPPLAEVEPEHFMRCHIPIEELRVLQTSGEIPVRGASSGSAGSRPRRRVSDTPPREAVVVGGGIAGLAAAWNLRNRDVLVSEAADRLGEAHPLRARAVLAHTRRARARRAELATWQLAAEVGAELVKVPGHLVAIELDGRILVGGRPELYPFRLPLTMRERAALIRAQARGSARGRAVQAARTAAHR